MMSWITAIKGASRSAKSPAVQVKVRITKRALYAWFLEIIIPKTDATHTTASKKNRK